MASIQLRALIDSILNDISRDMREQADVVETEFARRISEMSDSMQKMIHNMREVIHTMINDRIISISLDRHSMLLQQMKRKSTCFAHQYERKKDRLKLLKLV